MVAANGEPAASVHLACQKLGAGTVPLNVRYSADELAYCLNDATPRAVMCDDTTAAVVQQAIAQLETEQPLAVVHAGDHLEGLIADQPGAAIDMEVGADDISVMLYTAGTTGRPKGVPRSHHAEVSAGLAHGTTAPYSPAGE